MSDGTWGTTDEEKVVPTVTVLGVLKDGTRLIKPDWGTRETAQLGERALAGLATLGIVVNDDPAKYVF